MSQTKHDLVVIGAGPGGYVAAIRAAQLGFNVACVEKEDRLGGTCLRVGCIPSKALLESTELYQEAREKFKEHGLRIGSLELDLASMLQRKNHIVQSLTKGIDGLLKKNKVTRYSGHATIAGPGTVRVCGANPPAELRCQHVIIATGSKASSLPGVEWDGDRIGSSTEALSYARVPEHLVVIGAGYIGLELGSVWGRLGARVTVLEYLNRILPGMDSEVAKEARKIFEEQGMKFHLGAKVASARAKGDRCVVQAEGLEPIDCDRVLVAAGRSPNTEDLGLESVQIRLDEKGRIPVNEFFATTAPGIYAIGDVIRGPMLAHKAEEEGIACAEYLATGRCHVNYDAIPGVVYTEPEIASVGRTEDQLKEEKREYKKGVFPFLANGRARALGKTQGRVKVLADARTDRVLGVHIIGPRAGDLIAEAAVAIAFGASSEDLALCSHAHPTLAEAVKEASLGVRGNSLHV